MKSFHVLTSFVVCPVKTGYFLEMKVQTQSIKKIILLFAFVLTGTQAQAQKDTASLLVLIDLSSSMSKHRAKLVQLAPLVEEAMKKSSCKIQVGVGNIEYVKPRHANNLKPWGRPAWVTKDTPDGPDKIYQRISDPEGVVYPDGDEDRYGLASSGSEITYSSLVDSIKKNIDAFKTSSVVGTILLTDAAPSFEKYTPEQAARMIHDLLGSKTSYISAVIGPELSKGMMVPDQSLFQCVPDFNGTQLTPGSLLSTSNWETKDIEAINKFTKSVRGSQWDICQPNYDRELQQLIYQILIAGGCLAIS